MELLDQKVYKMLWLLIHVFSISPNSHICQQWVGEEHVASKLDVIEQKHTLDLPAHVSRGSD